MYMFKYICKRFGLMLMTFAIIYVMCFVLIKLVPIDWDAIGAIGEDTTKIKTQMIARGYDKPILEQLVLYLKAYFSPFFMS